jgi:hypothetical protein
VARWRQPGAGEILLAFVLLTAISSVLGWLSHTVGPQTPLPAFLVAAFLAWRVARGGRLSRMFLIVASAVSYAAAAFPAVGRWNPAVAALVITCAAQIALLVSPPVYGRTRPVPVPARARGWRQIVRRPPAWLLPWGLLAGVLLTLAALAGMDFTAIAGCRPAASDACTALVEGYPLRWLTARQNDPMIFKAALLKDCVQWTMVSTSILYLAWLRLAAPASPSE